MTATRMRLLVGLATLAVAVAAWLVAAAFLWRTSVPHDLKLPHLDPADYFSARDLHRAEHFQCFLDWEFVAGTLVQLAALAAIAVYGPRLARTFAVGRVGRGVLVGVLASTTVWAAGLPFDLASAWWQRRYGISREGYGEWAGGMWGTLTGAVVGTTIVVAILMSFAAWFRAAWWVSAGILIVAVGAGIALLQPLLLFDTHPLRNRALASRIEHVARVEGVGGTKVEVEDVHTTTTAANAETIGFGPTRRVIFWDTLLDGRFTPREIVFVAAHEFGHVKSRHILKGIGWSVLVVFPELALLGLLTRRRGGLREPGAIPLALLVLAVLGLALLPAFNVVSRRYEAEADWRALQATHDPDAGAGLFERFATTSLQEARPSTWDYVFFENHPTIIQRIAMAKAWEARNR